MLVNHDLRVYEILKQLRDKRIGFLRDEPPWIRAKWEGIESLPISLLTLPWHPIRTLYSRD
jgi:hypothetical protein